MTNEALSDLRLGLKQMVIRECNVKNLAPAQITDVEPIIGGTGALALDSLDAVEIVSALERNFGIKLEDAGSARGVVKNIEAMSDFVVANTPPEKVESFVRGLVSAAAPT